ncbi:hypothetical protein BDV10DRAFT_155087 [Aspergillus recurvatus]
MYWHHIIAHSSNLYSRAIPVVCAITLLLKGTITHLVMFDLVLDSQSRNAFQNAQVAVSGNGTTSGMNCLAWPSRQPSSL